MDHFSGADEAHPIRRMTARVSALVKAVEDLDPAFMRPDDKAAALTEIDGLEDRLRLVKLGLARASDDVAADAGFRTVGGWRAAVHHRGIGTARADDRLAEALDRRWSASADAVRDGRASLEQVRVIVKGLDTLADALEAERKAVAEQGVDVDPDGDAAAKDAAVSQAWITDVLVRGEAHLLDCAADHTPRELERLAERLLTVVAPEHADELERRALERAERRADTDARLRMQRRGDGTTRISARVPDAAAHILKTFLDSLTSPRVTMPGQAARGSRTRTIFGDPGPQRTVVDPWLDPETGRRVPQDRRHGQAFVALLERITSHHLPQHGGLGASVVVTIDYESLRDGVGHGTIGDPDGEGADISVGEVRRLACASGLLPAVLGSDSQVLDLGRLSRFFSSAQRKAHAITHPTCEAAGCTVPAAWSESHHKREAWAAGGTTDLADLAFLCPWHHHRAHDPTYRTRWLPGGGVRFHRRR
jgi:hypothetical protein